MKNFIKKNWFKISILLVLIILGFIYFLVTTYNQDKQNIINCRISGEEYRKNEINENPTISFFAPKYTYNKKLDTCIYSGGYVDSTVIGSNYTRYLKDLNTNEEITSSMYVGTEKLYGVDRFEFNLKEKELFNN